MKETYLGDINRKKLLEIGNVRNKSLLDIGVGELAIIAAKDFNCNVTSIDTDKGKLREAKQDVIKEKLKNKIRIEREDATNLSYSDNKFDISISYGALHHTPIEKRGKFISELYRVSKEKVIIAEFNKFGFPHSEDEYKRVDLNWLEKKLNLLSLKVDKYQGKEMNIYICFKDEK